MFNVVEKSTIEMGDLCDYLFDDNVEDIWLEPGSGFEDYYRGYFWDETNNRGGCC